MVVYQVYPRSFQDSDGDGVGDLAGITSRLGHLQWLGVDALWLSPVYPSPMADFGYDVAGFTDVDPLFGSLEDLDRLTEVAHARGIDVLLDLVPCHTSIEHPWFTEHPDWYVWADEVPNNWRAAFGGPAWSRHESGRYYLHSFYPEQPDLDWSNPQVVEAMQGVVAFWRARGIDGFRLDAVDRLSKDPGLRDDPPGAPGLGLPRPGEFTHSRNGPGTGAALAALREAAGSGVFLVGEVFLHAEQRGAYLEHLDRTFAFDLFFSEWSPNAVRDAIDRELDASPAWVLSNHDFPRLPQRLGPGQERLAATLLLTLPGTAFIYQGDEIGMGDGPGHRPPYDRAGRDRHRHPMQWTRGGGFTECKPWLPYVDPVQRNVEDHPELLDLYRDLIRDHDEAPALEWLPGAAHELRYRRGDREITLDFDSNVSIVA